MGLPPQKTVEEKKQLLEELRGSLRQSIDKELPEAVK
jgi:hypothetical protein